MNKTDITALLHRHSEILRKCTGSYAFEAGVLLSIVSILCEKASEYDKDFVVRTLETDIKKVEDENVN